MYLGHDSNDSQPRSQERSSPEPDAGRVDRLFGAIVGLAIRLRWLVLLVAVAGAVGSAFLAARTLSITTDTARLLSPELPFRQAFQEYRNAFPQFEDTLVVVVDGPRRQSAMDAARTLSDALRAQPDLFKSVYYPAGSTFFRRNGLLFLSTSELDALSERLSRVQPLLGTLARDPSLRGLFQVLGTVLEGAGRGDAPVGEMKPFVERVAAVTAARSRGEDRTLDWAQVLAPDSARLDGRRQVIVVQPALDFSRLMPGERAMAEVRRLAAAEGLTAENGLRVRLTGPVAINNEELSSVAEGSSLAGAVSFVLVTLLLFAGLRSRWLVGSVMLTLVFGLLWTAGFAALAIGSLNLISVAFAVPFIGLAVDFGIHYALRFEEAAQAHERRRDALRSAARSVGRALGLSAAAAALAFFAFVPTDYQGVAELGLLAGVGVLIAFGLSLTALPVLLFLRPRSRPRVPSPGEGRLLARMVRTEKAIKRRGKAVTVAAVAAGFVAFALAPAAQFDRNPLNLKDASTESVATAIELRGDPNLKGDAIQVLAPNRERARALAERISKLQGVASVRSLESFVPRRQEQKLEVIRDMALLLNPVIAVDEPRPPPDAAARGEAVRGLVRRIDGVLAAERAGELAAPLRSLRDSLNRILESPDRGARLAQLERGLIGDLPQQIEALRTSLQAQPVTVESLPASIRSRYLSPQGLVRLEVVPEDGIEERSAVRDLVQRVSAIAPRATGSMVFELGASDVVVNAYIRATIIALILISLVVLIVLRRLISALLVLMPVFLAGAFTLAFCAVVGLELNFANIIVLPLLVGLGAAGGIHIVRRSDRSGTDLVHTSTPRAVLFSALTTLASFGALALSDHRGSASMGELLFVAIFFSLICSLLLLPAIMSTLAGPGRSGP